MSKNVTLQDKNGVQLFPATTAEQVLFNSTVSLKQIIDYVTPQMYGAKGDGITDDTSAIQNALNSGNAVCVPKGKYIVTSPLNVAVSIVGDFATRNAADGAVLLCDFEQANKGVLNITGGDAILINNIAIDLQECDNTNGIYYNPSSKIPVSLDNVQISNLGSNATGIYINTGSSTSRSVYGNNIGIIGKSYLASHGIYIGANANDCQLSNIEIMYVKIGLEQRAGGLRLSNAHIYCGNSEAASDQTKLDEYFPSTICINNHGNMVGSDIYLDSAYQHFVQRFGMCCISNLQCWGDAGMDAATSAAGTVIRAAEGAFVKIGELLIGGAQNKMSTFVGDGVTVESIATSFGGINTSKPLFNPLMERNENNDVYNIYTGAVAYHCVAVLCHPSGYGNANFIVSTNGFAEEISVQYDGSWHFTKTDKGQGTIPIYYKIDGAFVYLYVYNRLNSRIQIKSNFCSYNLALIDFNGLRNFSAPNQSDSTGLTLIS